MSRKASLLWVDLEMTGLSPEEDRILEGSFIATDWKLREVGRMSVVVKVDEELMKRRMRGEFWEKNADSRRGLMEQNGRGVSRRSAERAVLEMMGEYFGKEVYLAGNSVYQDRKFIEKEWPKVAERVHYRMLDVSAWKVWFEHVRGVKMKKLDGHRAEGDVEASIFEFRKYLEFVK